jgi:hypothetical protein
MTGHELRDQNTTGKNCDPPSRSNSGAMEGAMFRVIGQMQKNEKWTYWFLFFQYSEIPATLAGLVGYLLPNNLWLWGPEIILSVISTDWIGTIIFLINLLINLYPLLLWLSWWCRYAITCCGTANATVASVAAAKTVVIANVILTWFIVHDNEME